MNNRSVLLVGAMLACVMPMAAVAEPADYPACDGYPAPKPKKKLKPGEAQQSWRGWGGLGPQHGVLVRGLGVTGIAACERAMADPVLVPEFWMRRASLIRARALHEMGEKNDKAALETLDEVDALYVANEKGEALASSKMASDALRAVALYRLKKHADAEKLLVSINERRPYAPSITRLTTSIRMLFDADSGKRMSRLREQSPLNPATLRFMLILAMQTRDFEKAILYADQISFDLPKGRGGWTLQGESERTFEQVVDRASIRGARAYALLAMGKMEESARELKAARDQVAASMDPPVPATVGAKISKQAQRDYQKRLAAGARATATLDDWSRAIALRIRAPKLTLKELSEDPERPRAEAVVTISDLLVQLRATDLRETAAIDGMIEAVARMNEASTTKALSISFHDLTRMLPAQENELSRPKMRNEGGNFWRTDLEGYRVMKADDPDLVNVRMGTLSASPAMVEEATLLIAANHVASLGKDGFVIESAQMIKRSTTVSGFYTGGYTSNSGYEYRILIRPIQIAAGEEAPRHWRALKVPEIRAALAAKYPPQQ